MIRDTTKGNRYVEKWKAKVQRPQTKDVIYASTVSSLNEDSDSEFSYTARISVQDIYETFIYLYNNSTFMLSALMATVILFSMHTYELVFRKNYLYYWKQLIESLCCLIIFLDILSSILHRCLKGIAARRAKEPRYIRVIIADAVFQLLAEICSNAVPEDYYLVPFSFELLRLFRVFVFFYYISDTPGFNTMRYNLLKFGLVSFLCTHIAATIAYIISKELQSTNTKTWMREIPTLFPNIETGYMLEYLYSCVIVLSAEGSLGYVNASDENVYEQILLIITMLVGLLFISGIFLGTFTTLRTEVYRQKAIFHHHINLITKNMKENQVPSIITRNIKDYYVELWSKEGGTSKSKLLLDLPKSMQLSVSLDKYWNIFERSNLLNNTHTGFKRAVSSVMTSRIFSRGEVVCQKGELKSFVILVVKGNIQLLSAEDMESPLITFGAGTVIGEASLVCSTLSSVQIITSSYCVIQYLLKSQFWRIAVKYRKLHQSEIVHAKHKKILRDSSAKHFHKKATTGGISLQKLIARTKEYSSVNKEVQCLYVVNEHLEMHRTDEVFYRTKFPWILRTESHLIFSWDLIIVVMTALTLFFLPYYLAFELESKFSFYTMRIFIQLFYALDVLFQLFIIVEDDNGTYTTFKEIAAKRIASILYHLDIIAAFPCEIFFFIFHLDADPLIISLFMFVRLLKAHKIIIFFSKIENTFKFNIAILRLFKYVLFILYLSYLMGSIYYIFACRGSDNGCNRDSWAGKLQKQFPELTTTQIFYNAFQAGFLILTLAGGGVLIFATKTDLLIITTFMLIGVLLFTYIASDYGATLILMNLARDEYATILMTVRKLSELEMYKSQDNQRNLRRIYFYLSMQWKYDEGQSIEKILEDAPKHIYDAQQSAKYNKIYENIPIFQYMGREIFNKLSSKSELVYFSPNETFINGNEKCTDLFILVKGYCELISGENRIVEKVIGPGTVISMLEVMMGVNNLYFVRPITSVAVVKLSQKNLYEILRNYRKFETDLRNYKNVFLSSLKVSKLFNNQTIYLDAPDYKFYRKHIFSTPNDKTDPLYQNYINGWSQWIYLSYLMLPFTILPEGRYIIVWEVVYNIMMFVLIIASLSTDIWESLLLPFDNTTIFFEVVPLFAIYIRFHMCYYNESGILVTHPRFTAKRYITSAFIIDAISAIPISRIFKLLKYKELVFSESMCSLNRVLQLYRLLSLFHYFLKDEFMPVKITMNILKFLPITIVFLSICSAFLLRISTDIYRVNGRIKLVSANNSITDYMSAIKEYNFDTKSPQALFLFAFLWVTACTIQLGFNGVFPSQQIEVIVLTAMMLLGYLLFTYILVIITNSQTSMNRHLTIHQNHMKDIKLFMKKEKISKYIQTEAIDYFEYSWQQDHGVTLNKLKLHWHRVLREDFFFDLYKTTFTQVPIFTSLNSNVYRILSVHLERIYILPDVPFIKINDVISYLYIVHSGNVKVLGPNGKQCELLGVGSVIGNLDNVTFRRSMVTYVSSGSIDLLRIPTKQFYNTMMPSINTNLQKHICLNNLSYVKGVSLRGRLKEDKFVTPKGTLTLRKKQEVNILMSPWLEIIYLMCSYFSFQYSIYEIAFSSYYIHDYLGLGFFDMLHVIIIILKFFTPYYDAKGQLITSRKLIKKRLLHHSWFYFNMFATIPLDLLFLVLLNFGLISSLVYRISLSNRLLRVYNIVYYFGNRADILDTDLMRTKLSSIFIYLTMVLNVQAGFFYRLAAYDREDFYPKTWAYRLEKGTEVMFCYQKYICSFYISTSYFTSSGYSIYPRFFWSGWFGLLLGIMDRFIVSILLAKLSAAIQNYTAQLNDFDNKFLRLRGYLKRSFVSKELIRIVIRYTDQLWFKSHGKQEPVLLQRAPIYLQEKIKSEAFGKHIYNNLVFCNCHVDFLRHLVSCLRMETYFMDDVICEQGDINESMYFIHQGVVEVYYNTATEEIKVDELIELDCFGIIQGLYPRTPHTHTFKAMVVTVVLTLKLSDWFNILTFFPASKYQIYETINTLC